MNCHDCQEHLTSLLFGELEESLSLSAHEHLASCDKCRESYIELVEAQGELEIAINDSESAGLSSEQKNFILNGGQAKSSTLKFPPWFFALAACLVIGGFIFISQNDDKVTMAKNEEAKADRALAEPQSKQAAKPVEAKNISVFKDQAEEMDLDAAQAAAPEKEVSRKVLKKAEAAPLESQSLRGGQVTEKAKKLEVSGGMASPAAIKMESGELSFKELKTMMDKFLSKVETGAVDKKLISELKSISEDSVKLVFSSEKTDSKEVGNKILVRILNNDKSAIDYANIYIHNQNIIRVERVKKN